MCLNSLCKSETINVEHFVLLQSGNKMNLTGIIIFPLSMSMKAGANPWWLQTWTEITRLYMRSDLWIIYPVVQVT